MIEMAVGEEDVGIQRPLGDQFAAQFTQACSTVENQSAVAAHDFQARGIAAIANRFGAGTGDTAANTPKFNC